MAGAGPGRCRGCEPLPTSCTQQGHWGQAGAWHHAQRTVWDFLTDRICTLTREKSWNIKMLDFNHTEIWK